MKTRILVLKHQLTVKYLIFWLGGQLLVEKNKNSNNNNQPYSEPPEKDLEKPSYHIGNCHLLDPPAPLRIFVALRGEGMAIFWNYTIHVLFTWKR